MVRCGSETITMRPRQPRAVLTASCKLCRGVARFLNERLVSLAIDVGKDTDTSNISMAARDTKQWLELMQAHSCETRDVCNNKHIIKISFRRCKAQVGS